LPVVRGEGTHGRHLERAETRIVGEIEGGGRHRITQLGQARQ
jgi:hypothetical protein